MIFKVIVTCILINILHIWNVNAHGKLMDPVGRSSAWRKGFNVTKNFSDNELFCGGFAVQYEKNKGNCGPCGDDWSKPRPRDNENGGTYGQGVIVSRYKETPQPIPLMNKRY
ncbi:uncharacterized protein LOC111643703 [Copidosoma floridanum]|uniref:uncharacterized protein LOC111643703 n=1 Tax=Copidosoma floridanum TaxID=29053 RepID=UPI000C6F6B41|nr:uncharacterized protein LOC111643703 [Copidosoma floridanum]